MISKLKSFLQFDNWIQLIMERIFFRDTTLQVHRVGDLQMLVDHRGSDAGSIRTCLATPMYKQFLSQCNLERDITVLDIGANVGGFSLLLGLNHNITNLVCLELNPVTYERLRFNIKTNLGLGAHVKNVGVWFEKGEISARMGFGSTGDSITPSGKVANSNLPERVVQTDTVNNIIERYFGDKPINICKIDIEGAESDVFLKDAAQCSRLAQVKYLIIEIHHLATYEQVLNYLTSLGFRLISQEADNVHGLGVHCFENL